MSEVTCANCAAIRPPSLASSSERPPCPTCGETALVMNADLQVVLGVEARLSSELVPGNQARDWRQRWQTLQEDLRSLSSPNLETMSGTTIHAEYSKLCSFFIQAYHLKDALVAVAPTLGLTEQMIEDAVSQDPRLALLADVANTDKHTTLTRPPRSGAAPLHDMVSGVDNPRGPGWILSAKFTHGTRVVDGLTIAAEAVDAWGEKIKLWGLA